jgi:UDP-N-acetylmuramoyl-L-alanyl-D-glutamate--2,6-diaminopimelate ligase
MKLSELLHDGLAPLPTVAGDANIAGLTADSRAVLPGWLFAALPGSAVDGRDFIPSAVEHGAAAILTTDDANLDSVGETPVVQSANARRTLALMAAAFYGAQPETVVTITGTNGKTSIASFTRQIWGHLGIKGASMGTLGIAGPGVDRPGSLTTPDPVSLHADLAAVAMRGISHLALEASSHGLDQFRLDGVIPAAAAFTNLTRDHIDYHETMDAYLAAKLRLFGELLPEGAPAVLNADSDAFEEFHAICQSRSHQILTYGANADDDGYRVQTITPTLEGLRVEFSHKGAAHSVSLPLIGTFQAGNALCALGLAAVTGADFKAALKALEKLEGAPGRMQRVATHPNGAPVFVDYAHTPDALETVLSAMRPHTDGRLVVVFGCGGDRDPGKRPMMGQVASAADIAIVTDDNPRSEDPAAIRAQIMAACPDGVEIGDRAEAIGAALSLLEPSDLLVIAGKGHETGQIVGDTTHPFDDALVAREAVAALAGVA